MDRYNPVTYVIVGKIKEGIVRYSKAALLVIKKGLTSSGKNIGG